MTDRAPLLLLPGLLCDARLWDDQLAGLADIADAQVADLTLDDSVSEMVARALAHAPLRFALAGLSMGGYVAFEIMRQAPVRVMRLALIATSAAPDPPVRANARRAAMRSLELGRFLGVTGRLLPQLVHPDHVEGPVGDAVQAMAARVGGDAFLRQQRAILGRPDSRPLLPRIAVPTLIAVGDGDRLTPPAEAHAMHAALPAAQFHLFHSCGHLPPLERPDETTNVLRHWLGQGENA